MKVNRTRLILLYLEDKEFYTFEDFLSVLTPYMRKKFLSAVEPQENRYGKNERFEKLDYFFHSFTWVETTEGYDYWRKKIGMFRKELWKIKQ